MDCFFHHAVPSVALCRECGKPVCGTCRTESGDCPSCRMAAKIERAKAATMIDGGIGPSSGAYRGAGASARAEEDAPPPRVTPAAAVARHVPPETRALVALGYPFWPLALLALLDGKRAHWVRRQAWQALGFNLGMWGFGSLVWAAASIPVLGIGAWPLVPFIVPITVIASIVFAVRAWQGEDVNVPIVSDWVDARLPAQQA